MLPDKKLIKSECCLLEDSTKIKIWWLLCLWMNWDWTLEFRGMTLAKESFDSFAQRRGELYCGQVQYLVRVQQRQSREPFLPHRTPHVRLEATQGWHGSFARAGRHRPCGDQQQKLKNARTKLSLSKSESFYCISLPSSRWKKNRFQLLHFVLYFLSPSQCLQCSACLSYFG